MDKIIITGDGAHCGLADWYPNIEKQIIECLAKGPEHEWTTGWYSSKKEIASANITCQKREITIKVSVSDYFDTEGVGTYVVSHTNNLDFIRTGIYRAWDKAVENQKDNRQHKGYSLLRHYKNGQTCCKDYFIANASDFLENPPDDNYSYWGWQNDYNEEDEEKSGKICRERGVTKEMSEKFTKFATSLSSGSLKIGNWELKEWN